MERGARKATEAIREIILIHRNELRDIDDASFGELGVSSLEEHITGYPGAVQI